MNDYTFCVSLSIKHPSITPDEITERLSIEPTSMHTKGEQRKTVNGKRLVGKNNYWSLKPHKNERLSASNIHLEDYILSLNHEYAEHKDYFSNIVETGGYIEYFIGWFEGDYNLMATLSPKLLQATGELNIAIGLDVYTS